MKPAVTRCACRKPYAPVFFCSRDERCSSCQGLEILTYANSVQDHVNKSGSVMEWSERTKFCSLTGGDESGASPSNSEGVYL